jgi:chromosome condensin MukBEF MukE localization factor
MTIYSDAMPIEQPLLTKTGSRAKTVYNDLLAAAEALLAMVKTRSGKTNKDNAKLAGQIRSLIDKWRE